MEITDSRIVLVTGFEPFGGLTDNPSDQIVRVMEGETIGQHTIVARTLPVTFKDAPLRFKQLLYQFKPALVISLGLAGGEKAIRLERQAVNKVDFRIADNAAEIVKGCIHEGGPKYYHSSLPLESILKTLEKNKIPARLSDSAGAFVCNALMYSALNACSHPEQNIPCGFIHLPFLPEQLSTLQVPGGKSNVSNRIDLDGTADGSLHSMPLSMQIEAVRLTIETCIEDL